MFFIIVGCGRVGAELASGLYRKGHQVSIVDFVGSSFEHLPPDYRGRTIEGEVLNEGVLERAGIRQADGLAAVTNSDSVNTVVSHIARRIYKVRNVVARNYDPRWRPMHEAFALDTVSSTAWGAQRIEEQLCAPTLRAVLAAGNGEVEIYEVIVPADWNGRSLEELASGPGCVVVAHARGGRAGLPAAGQKLETGDIVHISASDDGVTRLRQRLGLAEGGPR